MKGQELDWGRCPDCGEELFNISDSEENLVMCGKCGKTFPEPPLGPVTKRRKEKKGKELRLPFGKHKGKAISVILVEEPGYLCWFHDAVDGTEEVKQAIAALPQFPMQLAQYRERKGLKDKTLDQKIEEVVARMFAVEPTPQEIDDLCDRLFHEGS
jgi:ribosomal protein S27AE